MKIFIFFNKTLMKFLVLVFVLCSEYGYSQFLNFQQAEKRGTVEFGLLNNFFKLRDDYSVGNNVPLGFTHVIPYIAFREDNLFVGLGYSNFTYDKKSVEEIFLNAYYGTTIRALGNFRDGLFIPILLRTGYLKLFQEIGENKSRFEVGNFGIGTGLKAKYNLNFADLDFHYHFIINYSTINFSVEYGYSIYNEAEILLNFNNILNDYGFEIGVRYYDEKWSMSDKKYDYFGSWAGGFIGINF
jgi:hypothetical protein